MPRIFAASDELKGGEITLRGETHHYVTRVLRMGAGDVVRLFDGAGQEVEATIVRAGSQGVTLTLGERTWSAMAAAVPPVTLLQGLPRADRMDMIVQKAAELGVARIIPVRTQRTARGQKGRLDRWQRIAREAERQCGRTEAVALTDTMELERALAFLIDEVRVRIMPWEEAPDAPSIVQLMSSSAEAAPGVAILIGPEGGMTAQEAEVAMHAGFRVATLGPRILRTETAAIAALAVIQSLVGGLGPR